MLAAASAGQPGGPSDTGTLVLGAAVGYTEAQLAPFLVSLRKAGYQGSVALIVEPHRLGRYRNLDMFAGVTLLPAAQWLPVRLGLLRRRYRPALVMFWYPVQTLLWTLLRLAGVLRSERLQFAIAKRLYPPTENRFVHYLEYLRQHRFGRILLTDVRDVLFQEDPFPHLPAQGLAVSIESRQYRVATEEWNAAWVRLIYGPSGLERIGQQPVSCSGVTYGDYDSIVRYLELMIREVLGLGLRAARHCFFDQGMHNMLLWTDQLGRVQFLETLEGPVATLSGVDASQLHLNEKGRLLNRDGSIACVVHQYDRVPEIQGVLLGALA